MNLDSCSVCDDDAGVTLQRQGDVGPVPFCLQHAAAREDELKLKLESYQRVVVVALPPTELEQARARLAELEGDGGGVRIGLDGQTAEQQLETAVRTLELQAQTLERTRTDLAESRQAFDVAHREVDRLRGELERTKAQGAELAAELERLRSVGPITPPPPTRPDRK